MAFDEVNRAPHTPDANLGDETVLGLLKRLTDELTTLFRQEVALATSEVTGALSRLAASVLVMVAGAAVLFAGFLLMLAAAVVGLSAVVTPWIAALVIGGAVAIAGLGLVLAGGKGSSPSSLKPKLSPESLRKDKAVLTRNRL